MWHHEDISGIMYGINFLCNTSYSIEVSDTWDIQYGRNLLQLLVLDPPLMHDEVQLLTVPAMQALILGTIPAMVLSSHMFGAIWDWTFVSTSKVWKLFCGARQVYSSLSRKMLYASSGPRLLLLQLVLWLLGLQTMLIPQCKFQMMLDLCEDFKIPDFTSVMKRWFRSLCHHFHHLLDLLAHKTDVLLSLDWWMDPAHAYKGFPFSPALPSITQSQMVHLSNRELI